MMNRRSALFGVGACFWGASACSSQKSAEPRRYYKKDSKAIAFQGAKTNYELNAMVLSGWERCIAMQKKDAVPFLKALQEKGHGIQMEFTSTETAPLGVVVINVKLAYPKRAPDGTVIEETDPIAIARAKAGAPPEGVDMALFGSGMAALMTTMQPLNQINAINDGVQRGAFAAMVVKEKVNRGEKADFYDPERPKEETIADIDLYLKLVAQQHGQMQVWRAEMMTTALLVSSFDTPGGLELLLAHWDAQEKLIKDWAATHKEPTADDFGVALEELPEPSEMVGFFDKAMASTSAVFQVAMGVATGSPESTFEGLKKLAPKDDTVQNVLTGLQAAATGNVLGVIGAVGALVGKNKAASGVMSRLESAKKLAEAARGSVSSAKGTVDSVKGTVDSAKSSVD